MSAVAPLPSIFRTNTFAVTLPASLDLPRRLQLTICGNKHFRAMLFSGIAPHSLMYSVSPLADCHIGPYPGGESTLWVGNSAYRLSPTEARRVAELFGPRGLKVEQRA